MATMHEILCQVMQIKYQIGTESIVIARDRTIYSMDLATQWKHREKSESIIFRLVVFRNTSTFMAVLGKLFCHAKLRDISTESGVTVEGFFGGRCETARYAVE